MTDIRELVQVVEIGPGWTLDNGHWSIRAEAVEHGSSLGLTYDLWPCLGYRLEGEGKAAAISGDTVGCEGLNRLSQHADILVQCCYLAEDEIKTPDDERQARFIIASSAQAGKIAAQNQVGKLVLTHIRPKSEELMASLVRDARRFYSGEVILGEDLMVIEI
jgi:ribonuclease Z